MSIGVLLGTLLPSARAAQAIGLLLFFPSFLLGVGGPPPAVMSDPLRGDRGAAAAGAGEPGDPGAVARTRRRPRGALLAVERHGGRGHGVGEPAYRPVTSILGLMGDRTARAAAPAGLAVFALLGVLMTDRPTVVALAAAAVAVAVARGARLVGSDGVAARRRPPAAGGRAGRARSRAVRQPRLDRASA